MHIIAMLITKRKPLLITTLIRSLMPLQRQLRLSIIRLSATGWIIAVKI